MKKLNKIAFAKLFALNTNTINHTLVSQIEQMHIEN